MNNAINDEIEKYIGNRFYEYDHPFKYGSAGMEDFSKLIVILKELPDDECLKHIEEIEKLLSTLKACMSCSAKLAAFLILISKERFPEKCAEYEVKYNGYCDFYYEDSFRRPPKARDFKQEVDQAVEQWHL